MYPLHDLLGFLPRCRYRSEGRETGGHRPSPLQGMRHLRRGVPPPLHRYGGGAGGKGGGGMTITKPTMGRAVALNWAALVAEAMRQTHPDVVAAYPITPQTLIVENFSQFVANGQVDTQFVAVESEHAALSVCIGEIGRASCRERG